MTVRFALARRTAASLLKKRFKRLAAPIDVEDLAEAVGARIEEEAFGDGLSGMCYRDESGAAVIAVNVAHSQQRKRFTVAHEIGHLLLHSEEQLHLDPVVIGRRDPEASRGTSPKEVEANQFASCLLMPEDLIEKDVARLDGGLDDEEGVARLAQRYRVSVQAMTIRLADYLRRHGV